MAATAYALHILVKHKEIAQDILKSLTHKHRTLQASFIRILRDVMNQYADNASFDPRNEAAVNFCKEVKKIEGGIPHI